jgi:hypothetical protein
MGFLRSLFERLGLGLAPAFTNTPAQASSGAPAVPDSATEPGARVDDPPAGKLPRLVTVDHAPRPEFSDLPPLPRFTDRGVVAQVATTQDEATLVSAGIVKELAAVGGKLPGVGQILSTISEALVHHDNASGQSPQELAYAFGGSPTSKVTEAQVVAAAAAGAPGAAQAEQEAIARLARTQGRTGGKDADLIPGLAGGDIVQLGGIGGTSPLQVMASKAADAQQTYPTRYDATPAPPAPINSPPAPLPPPAPVVDEFSSLPEVQPRLTGHAPLPPLGGRVPLFDGD